MAGRLVARDRGRALHGLADVIGIVVSRVDGLVAFTHLVEQVGQVFDVVRDDVGHDAFALKFPRHAQQAPGHDFGAVFREHAVAPYDNVGRAGLVLEREEHNAGRRAGALAAHNKARDGDGCAVRIVSQLVIRHALAKL